jgi:hypothetical protein
MGNFFSKEQRVHVPLVPEPEILVPTSENPSLSSNAVPALDVSPDVAHIVSSGLHEDPEGESALQETLADLRAKYGFASTNSATATAASMEQEARLRALLKGKRKAAPA